MLAVGILAFLGALAIIVVTGEIDAVSLGLYQFIIRRVRPLRVMFGTKA